MILAAVNGVSWAKQLGIFVRKEVVDVVDVVSIDTIFLTAAIYVTATDTQATDAPGPCDYYSSPTFLPTHSHPIDDDALAHNTRLCFCTRILDVSESALHVEAVILFPFLQ